MSYKSSQKKNKGGMYVLLIFLLIVAVCLGIVAFILHFTNKKKCSERYTDYKVLPVESVVRWDSDIFGSMAEQSVVDCVFPDHEGVVFNPSIVALGESKWGITVRRARAPNGWGCSEIWWAVTSKDMNFKQVLWRRLGSETMYVYGNGIEDARAFVVRRGGEQQTWVICSLYIPSHNTVSPVVFDIDNPNQWKYARLPQMAPWEKNWSPIQQDATNEDLHLLHYSIEPHCIIQLNILTGDCTEVFRESHGYMLDSNFRGGTQWLPFKKGTMLTCAHLVRVRDDGSRNYLHLFIEYSDEFPFLPIRRSDTFKFSVDSENDIQFASGMAFDENGNILISFGAGDNVANLCRLDQKEVSNRLEWKKNESC